MLRRVTVAVEGPTDAAVVRAMLRASKIAVVAEHGGRGKDQLDLRLRAYNRAAAHGPWLVVRDLDHDAGCAPTLVKALLPEPNRLMALRIAVRKIESWLLADHEGISKFLGIPRATCPPNPDASDDPKRDLVALARRGRRDIRADMVPRAGQTVSVGPAYTSRVIEFAGRDWNPDRGAQRSESLRRCLAALRRLR